MPLAILIATFLNSVSNRMLRNPSTPLTRVLFSFAAILVVAMLTGCGTTKSFTATEQLLMSDAVDSAISRIDFRPLAGHKIFLDTSYLNSAKPSPANPNPMLVQSDYVISSLRQQMMAAGCYLVDSKNEAELVCEARIGALGTDGHAVTYGLPASNLLSTASVAISGAPTLPTIPEISLAKKELKSGASKIAVFAYTKDSRQPVWQSGIEQARSDSKDTWIMGIGPIQKGSIYTATQFAGSSLSKNANGGVSQDSTKPLRDPVDFRRSFLFASSLPEEEPPAVVTQPPPAGVAPAAGTPGQPAPPATPPAVVPASAPSSPR
jgi:hypothetical protein